MDSGATATNKYDALNRRVQTQGGTGSHVLDFAFNLNGQRVAIWDITANVQSQGQVYWGSTPIEYYYSSAAHFQHQDWLGTERMRTTYNGAVEGSYTSLPFGDGFAATGSDTDSAHFAQLDHDSSSNTDHAQFRQYSPTQGRWFSPDPYAGSYDLNDPQSLNRYLYARNNPMAFTDPSGQFPFCGLAGGEAAMGPVGWGFLAACVGGSIFDLLKALHIFNHPKFHGSLIPRPQAHTGPGGLGESLGLPTVKDMPRFSFGGIGGLLGLPEGQCEFGACEAGPTGFQAGVLTLGPPIAICAAAEPCGTIALGIAALASAIGAASVVKTHAPANETQDELDCATQWEDAREICRQLIANPSSPRNLQGSRGGRKYTNVEDCARGFVTEVCGGNPIDWGRRFEINK